jgi:hypothetical protein
MVVMMDESEQRKMADGLVCGLVLKKAVDLETKAKIESLEEEMKILKALNERYLKAINEAMHLLRCLEAGNAYTTLRLAAFATMPESDNDTKPD